MFDLKLVQKKRQILHVDADAFFASVEQLVNPQLRNKPVLVGGSENNKGIVSAASYEARKFGVHSAMPMYLAKKKCPEAIIVKGNFRLYREYSEKIRRVLMDFTPAVEMASIDEAYADISGQNKVFGLSARDFSLRILWEIYKKTGLSVSCGLASNCTVAKVASSVNKPHKFTQIPYGKERAFLAPLDLSAIPGFGKKTVEMFNRLNFFKVGDISSLSFEEVMKMWGVAGVGLWKKSLGIDNRVITTNKDLPKSISKEHTLYNKMNNFCDVALCMKTLSRIVFSKLRGTGLKAKTIFIKIRYKDHSAGKVRFSDFTFQKNLEFASSNDIYLFAEAKKLLEKNLNLKKELRLIGIGVSNLRENYNLSLFGRDIKDPLMEGVDRINAKYGSNSVLIGI